MHGHCCIRNLIDLKKPLKAVDFWKGNDEKIFAPPTTTTQSISFIFINEQEALRTVYHLGQTAMIFAWWFKQKQNDAVFFFWNPKSYLLKNSNAVFYSSQKSLVIMHWIMIHSLALMNSVKHNLTLAWRE